MENGLIISIKRVILIPSKFTSKFTKKDLGRVVTAKTPKTRINTDFFAIFSLYVFVSRKILIRKHKKQVLVFRKIKNPKTRINTGFLAHFRVEKRSKYMKATGIVRRIEECVIIGQKLKKPHKH